VLKRSQQSNTELKNLRFTSSKTRKGFFFAQGKVPMTPNFIQLKDSVQHGLQFPEKGYSE
jgi:hypothetical protein